MTRPDYLIDGQDSAPLTLVFTHGAGAPMDSNFMNWIALGVAAAGFRVVRFEFPYMLDRPPPWDKEATQQTTDPDGYVEYRYRRPRGRDIGRWWQIDGRTHSQYGC